ncbi:MULTISPECIES: DUF4157 domain-containing protein [Mucilaginibacter]|nr:MULTISPECIES: DUF4157 domain-containing protein [Mucilaginibacter]QTE46214.1 DUF4157 domain-containing protein [Mucilaginibacter rubeus]QTE52811.1 DUF4157 domain-containing protein [Mucilaginibacter rubeus]QTE57898.1 DUF4157 domain-containing protein [Mucilaginibacter rubeus]QTE62641.1 DUF4157 domain-containing protein [Mucilaginibacter rubeus]QTF61398.1 DUF4157 domain-containing protein [Mucilaginibacter rubeus]
MKTPQKAAPANTKQNQPANMQAAGKDPFFSAAHDVEQVRESPFFEGNKVQRKMTVNEPGDHFERQADQVADKVVQHINQPKTVANAATGSTTTTGPATAATSAVQKKEDKKEDKQEKEQNGADKELQRRPIFESDGDPNEGNTLKRSSQSAAPDVSPQTQQKIEGSKGGGEPLPVNTREEMEGAMGADLSAIRIHNNSEAAGLSNDLQAQAFTHGNDIYFGAGKYDPQSKSGQHLLAHEVTHTVQQGGNGVKKKGVIQRAETGVAESGKAKAHTGEDKIDQTNKTIKVEKIDIPGFKYDMMPSKTDYSFKKTTRSGKHLATWEKDAATDAGFGKKFDDLKKVELPNGGTSPAGNNTYFMVSKTNVTGGILFGNPDEIRTRSVRPNWRRAGQMHEFEVDHKVELQIGGADNDIGNLWLLSQKINGSSGGTIQANIKSAVDETIKAEKAKDPEKVKGLSVQGIVDNYSITTAKLNKAGSPDSVGDQEKYSLSEIQKGEHLNGMRFLVPGKDDKILKELVDTNTVHLFLNERRSKAIKMPKKGPFKLQNSKKYTANIDSVTYDPQTDIMQQGGAGSITVTMFKTSKTADKITESFTLNPIPGVYGGYVSRQDILDKLRPQVKALSPVQLSEAGFSDDGELEAKGKVHTTIPLIDNADIDIIINSNGLSIRKVFDGGEIKLPPPFKITDTSLGITLGDSGLTVDGNMNFEIKKLGKGEVHAKAGTSGAFALGGSFDFDSKTFNPARITVDYVKPGDGGSGGGLSATGEIGIGPNKIKGIKSAHINITYANNEFTATGTAEPDIKGVKSAEIHVSYANETLVIGGSFVLDENMPGIQSGSGSVEVTRGPDEIYHVKASGKAIPKIPKINTELSISYDDGALTIEGKASYAADRVSGEVTVGATNRAIAADGTPSGPAGDKFTAYGSGKLTLKVTDWLQASASVRVTPAGEIEVVGRLDLPSAVDVFPKKSINKELFKVPTIQIPIFAIPLGPKSIGIVATIDGGLDFDAAVGPGQLKDVFGQIEFNPSHPENTRISGGAKFVIPAHAGLKLKAALGIGLSIGPASVTGGIQIVGGLGLEGEASAAADLAWSPTTGFEFNALGEIEVHPKFTFDVNAFIKAELDLLVTDISKEWTKNLASFSYGPDLQVKVSLPIHYKDGEPFDVKTDDIKVTYPEISISDIAGGIADKVKEEML